MFVDTLEQAWYGKVMAPLAMLSRFRTSRPKTKAYWAIVGSVLGFAFVPLTIEKTATDSNPFYFNAFATVTQTATLLIYLYVYVPKTFENSTRLRDPVIRTLSYAVPDDSTESSKIGNVRPVLRLLILEGSRHLEAGRRQGSSLGTRTRTLSLGWMTLPLIWLILSRLEYAFFAWSTDHIDAAVTATLFRLWPLLMIFSWLDMVPDYDPCNSAVRRRSIISQAIRPSSCHLRS